MGSGGNDIISAGAGNDYLDGDIGIDQLTGGSGYDYFVFAAGYGSDTITDFNQAERDVIRLSLGAHADTLAEVMAIAYQVGSDVVFSFSAHDNLTVQNMQLTHYTSSDWYFA